MKNDIKKIWLRAAQIAVASIVIMTIINAIIIKINSYDEILNLPWIIQGAIIATAVSVIHLVIVLKEDGLAQSDFLNLWIYVAVLFGIIIAAMPTKHEELMFIIGAVATMAISGLSVKPGTAILFGIFWVSTFCLFDHIKYTGIMIGFRLWVIGVPLILLVILTGRGLRWLFKKRD